MNKLIRYSLLTIAVVLLVIWIAPYEKRTSTTSLFTIVSKYEKDNKLWIQGYNPNTEQRKEIRVQVKDPDIWSTMSTHETYMITHFQRGDRDPVFVEIVTEQ